VNVSGFVVYLSYNKLSGLGNVADLLYSVRFVVGLLYTCCGLVVGVDLLYNISTCHGVVDLL